MKTKSLKKGHIEVMIAVSELDDATYQHTIMVRCKGKLISSMSLYNKKKTLTTDYYYECSELVQNNLSHTEWGTLMGTLDKQPAEPV